MRDRESVQRPDMRARSATSINTADMETLVSGGSGYPGVRHEEGYTREGGDEYYGKWHESDVGSSTVDRYRDEMGYAGQKGNEREYHGKYEKSGTGTIDTYEQGVRDSYAEGKEEEFKGRQERQERTSYYGPDGVRRYGRDH